LAWHRVPVLDRTHDRAYGRVELRTLKAVSVGGFGFPHSAQVVQVTRKSRNLGTRRWRTVVVYAVTSLAHAQASSARLADLLGGHWAIENGLHYVRDVTFAEDASQVRSGTGPQVMACLRNLVIGTLSRAGPVNLAAALGYHARDPARPLATLGITLARNGQYVRTQKPGPAYQRHGPGREARGHAERRRSGPVPSRPSPSGPHHWKANLWSLPWTWIGQTPCGSVCVEVTSFGVNPPDHG
jgi:predicted transposase YbfD/YdcC